MQEGIAGYIRCFFLQQAACVRVTTRRGRTVRTVVARDGYTVESVEQFTVTGRRTSSGLVKERATRIRGTLTNIYQPTAAGLRAGCRAKSYGYAFTGRRLR